MATKKAVEGFANAKNHSIPELKELLKECSHNHMKLTKDAALGQGCDRHLFSLRLLAEKSGLKKPEIFADESYEYVNHFNLSTSTLYGEYFTGGGFAPVVQDGFGLGYGYVDNQLGLVCSSYHPYKDGEKLVAAIKESLDEIHSVLESV